MAAWHINLAVLLNDLKRYDEARLLLQRAVQLAPQDSIACGPRAHTRQLLCADCMPHASQTQQLRLGSKRVGLTG